MIPLKQGLIGDACEKAKVEKEKIIINKNEGVNEGVIDEVSDAVRNGLVDIATIIVQNAGLRTNTIAEQAKVSEATVERYVSILKKLGLIEFKGIPKTGGYFVTEKIKKKLN